MCVNFRSASRAAIEAVIAADVQGDLYEAHEVWPRYTAPIIRQSPLRDGRSVADLAVFGLLPHWAKLPKIPQATMNARSETVATLPSFRDAWRKSQTCLVPMSSYFEPRYDESGKSVRWSIARNDAENFAVAGLWSWWAGRDGEEGRLSFSLLTVNCADHSVLNRFHAPEDEKRSLVHIPPHEYDAWLSADPELARSMLELPLAERLVVAPAPLPPRKPKAAATAALDES